jgi:hypothetical protein
MRVKKSEPALLKQANPSLWQQLPTMVLKQSTYCQGAIIIFSHPGDSKQLQILVFLLQHVACGKRRK